MTVSGNDPTDCEHRILRNKREFVDHLRLHLTGKSVAIVGSAPRLLEETKGGLIDSHDVVIRFNNSDNAAFPDSAGSRTSLRFILFNVHERHHKFFRNLDEESEIFTTSRNVEPLSAAGISRMNVLDFRLNEGIPDLCNEIIGRQISTSYKKAPRSGLVLLATIIGYKLPCSCISLFGIEREIRDSGPLHFYAASGSIRKMLDNFDRFHCPLDVEMKMLNALIESQDGFLRFH